MWGSTEWSTSGGQYSARLFGSFSDRPAAAQAPGRPREMRRWRQTSSDSSPRSTSSWPLAQRRLDRRNRPGGRVPPRPSALAELVQLPACVGRQRPPEFITSFCSPKRWDDRLAVARSHGTQRRPLVRRHLPARRHRGPPPRRGLRQESARPSCGRGRCGRAAGGRLARPAPRHPGRVMRGRGPRGDASGVDAEVPACHTQDYWSVR